MIRIRQFVICIFITSLSINGFTQEIVQKEINKSFGSFKIPNTFTESKKFSTQSKYYYLKNSDEDLAFPNNISINQGKNRYSIEENIQFREAILRQLLMQTKDSGAEVTGAGTYTDKKYLLYIFTITDGEYITTQYYIVGDYKFILIQETVKGESKETDETAKMMVNSFTWPIEKSNKYW